MTDRPMSPFGSRLALASDSTNARALLSAMGADAVPTADTRGGLLLGAAIADLTANPTMEDFNNLLAVLRAAGVIAPNEVTNV